MYCYSCEAEVAGHVGGECFYCGNLLSSDVDGEYEEMMPDRWIAGQPGGPQGPFYSVVSSTGRVIAMQIPDKEIATTIATIHNLWDAKLDYSPGCDCDYCVKLQAAMAALTAS